MKGKGFFFRLRYSFNGFLFAIAHESSFRTQLLAAFFALGSLLILHPPLVWAALVVVMVVLVLAAELINTAIEQVLDGLHPEFANFVRFAKDCSAAAVLILSLAAVVVYAMMLCAIFKI